MLLRFFWRIGNEFLQFLLKSIIFKQTLYPVALDLDAAWHLALEIIYIEINSKNAHFLIYLTKIYTNIQFCAIQRGAIKQTKIKLYKFQWSNQSDNT